MKITFSQEERQINRMAGTRIWEKENPQGAPGDYKMLIAPPDWNQNDEAGRRYMNDYHYLIISKGIKEALRAKCQKGF